ncbi:hypothetical protein FLONG3_5067 [Fusarium longipes]|uniref:Rhodopsin domain-containing protein n=1 Tax=Fusarium longipes TaxID=694270 RepID=A0A395SWE6_9HYPO|nr:hypothetical protein FLONG3_5067 [Fusarium longipes]
MDDASYFSESDVSGVLIIPHTVLSIIATVFVALRIWTARHITKTKASVDEWVSIVALLMNHALLIFEGICVHYGYGQNIVKVMTEYGGVSNFLRTFIGCEITYGLSCSLSKIAVLAMYYRIFSASRLLRYCTWIMATMIAGWSIAVVTVSRITIPNIMFDIATVVLPVREVWKLQMDRDKKWAITSIFLLGGSVVLASIARLVLFLIYKSSSNVTQVIIFGHMASSAEVCLAIIGACLPSCAPLLKNALQRFVSTVRDDQGVTEDTKKSGLVTIGQKRSRGLVDGTLNGDDMHGSFERLDDNGSFQDSPVNGLLLDVTFAMQVTGCAYLAILAILAILVNGRLDQMYFSDLKKNYLAHEGSGDSETGDSETYQVTQTDGYGEEWELIK